MNIYEQLQDQILDIISNDNKLDKFDYFIKLCQNEFIIDHKIYRSRVIPTDRIPDCILMHVKMKFVMNVFEEAREQLANNFPLYMTHIVGNLVVYSRSNAEYWEV